MTMIRSCIALGCALALGACGQTEAEPDEPARDPGVPNQAASAGPAPNAPAGQGPSLAPPLLTPEAEESETGARNILLSFARAIELKAFGQAWALLSPADKEKWSEQAFADIFAGLGEITVAAPDGTLREDSGQMSYRAPLTVTSRDQEGRPVRIEGEALLVRDEEASGETQRARRWHFSKLTLDWTH